jgi:hypothetical protein
MPLNVSYIRVRDRSVGRLPARGSHHGLPARPASLQPHAPPERVGQRVIPKR